MKRGITRFQFSSVLEAEVPAVCSDVAGHRTGLTRQALLTFVFQERAVEETVIFESLAEPLWRGIICMCDGQPAYSVVLFAAFLIHQGNGKTRSRPEVQMANPAHLPVDNVREWVRAIFGGNCDLPIGNTCSSGNMQTSEEWPQQKEWGSVRIPSPAVEIGSTHVNLSSMVMVKHTKHA